MTQVYRPAAIHLLALSVIGAGSRQEDHAATGTYGNLGDGEMTMAPNTSGILVGVDGSEFSDTAVRWAVREAAMRHEALTLMAVAERQGPRVTYDSETIHNSRQAQHSEGDRILAAARQIVDEVLGDRRSRQSGYRVPVRPSAGHPHRCVQGHAACGGRLPR